MMNTSNKIIFFGTEEFSLTVLTGLIEAGYDIAAVVTKPDSRKGRGQTVVAPSVKVVAEKHNIPVWQPVKLADITADIQALQPIAGVLVSYGKIIPQATINLFSPGIINVHPSLLPKYRGPSPIESAILNGDGKTGVTIMKLSAEMDAGPIYTAKEYPLAGTETQPQLYQELATFGTDLLLETLPRILASDLQPTPQDDSQASYCQLLTKADGQLDPQELTAAEAERRVRAYLRFPRVRVSVLEKDIIVTKAHISHEKTTELDIKLRDDKYLSIDELIAPSGKTMSGEAFLKGYKK
ncbi:MAG: fmt [Candidatus Saccharibacteria bacterium]|nr:fmt [Candidatus Saccharibacteria bacterium]